MNDSWQAMHDPSREQTRHLDQRSRRTLAEFLVCLCILSVMAVWLYLNGVRSVDGVLRILTLTCALAAVTGMVRAVARGEALGRGSLNSWDEMLAFVALSRLAHLAHGLQV